MRGLKTTFWKCVVKNGSAKSNSNYKEHIADPKPTLKGLLNLKILGVRLVFWIIILISLIIANKYKDIFSDKENSDVKENTKVEKKTENDIVNKEVLGSVEDDLIEQGYIENKPVLDKNKLNNAINELSNKIKDKDSLKNNTQTQWNELKQQLKNDKQKLINESKIKYDSLIIKNKTYYKIKQ